jgi:hypothetical protein
MNQYLYVKKTSGRNPQQQQQQLIQTEGKSVQ